eukprot:1192315-Prorocentrum_minimum.AAC.2
MNTFWNYRQTFYSPGVSPESCRSRRRPLSLGHENSGTICTRLRAKTSCNSISTWCAGSARAAASSASLARPSDIRHSASLLSCSARSGQSAPHSRLVVCITCCISRTASCDLPSARKPAASALMDATTASCCSP